jgi:hypothetical protein
MIIERATNGKAITSDSAPPSVDDKGQLGET